MSRKWNGIFLALTAMCSFASAQAQDGHSTRNYGKGPAHSSLSSGAASDVITASGTVRAQLASYGEHYSGPTWSGSGGDYANTPKPMGYGPMWPATGNRDCSRFYHYPYVYYPQNFYSNEYYRSSDSMYYRYPPEMQIPVYNKQWHNYYPSPRRYHWGHHFILDVF